MISLGGETVSDWAETLSVVGGLVDILAYQNLCTMDLWFVRYELIIKGDRICDFSVWQLPYLLLEVVVVVVDARLHHGEYFAAGVSFRGSREDSL
jgi:hypothetical protein